MIRLRRPKLVVGSACAVSAVLLGMVVGAKLPTALLPPRSLPTVDTRSQAQFDLAYQPEDGRGRRARAGRKPSDLAPAAASRVRQHKQTQVAHHRASKPKHVAAARRPKHAAPRKHPARRKHVARPKPATTIAVTAPATPVATHRVHTAPAPRATPAPTTRTVPVRAPAKTTPKPRSAPPVSFNQGGTSPTSTGQGVQFDNSGSGTTPTP